jgi:hypothetical protein
MDEIFFVHIFSHPLRRAGVRFPDAGVPLRTFALQIPRGVSGQERRQDFRW